MWIFQQQQMTVRAVENSEHVQVTWVGLCLRGDVEIVAMGDDEL